MKKVLQFILPYFIVVGLFQLLGTYVSGASIEAIENQTLSYQQELIISFFTLVGTCGVVLFFVKIVFDDSFSFRPVISEDVI